MQLVLIAAMGRNRVIGNAGKMPWHLPADFAYFKRMTANYPMLMGRTTLESLPGVLPGRRHIVLTRQQDWSHTGCEVFPDLATALQSLANETQVMVIGGADIYQQTLPLADTVLLTEIGCDFEGDRHFPHLNADEWTQSARITNQPDESNHYSYDFVTYHRLRTS